MSAVVTHAMGATRAVEYHSAEERRDILTPAATWRNLAVSHAVAEARRKRPRDLTSVGAGFVRAGRRRCLAGEEESLFPGDGIGLGRWKVLKMTVVTTVNMPSAAELCS